MVRFILRFLRGGDKKDALSAFFAGGAASFVTLYYDPSTCAEIMLYSLKLLFESIPKEALDKGVIKPSPFLFSLINFIALGLLFAYYETRDVYLKPPVVRGLRRLLADN